MRDLNNRIYSKLKVVALPVYKYFLFFILLKDILFASIYLLKNFLNIFFSQLYFFFTDIMILYYFKYFYYNIITKIFFLFLFLSFVFLLLLLILLINNILDKISVDSKDNNIDNENNINNKLNDNNIEQEFSKKLIT